MTRLTDPIGAPARALLLLVSLALVLAFTSDAKAASAHDYIVVYRDSVADSGAKTNRLERANGFATATASSSASSIYPPAANDRRA